MGAGRWVWCWVMLGAGRGDPLTHASLFDAFRALRQVQCGAPKTSRLVHNILELDKKVGFTGNISIDS